MTVTLTEEQQAAYDLAMAYLRDPLPKNPYFSIEGLAGTGKTEVLAKLAHACPDGIMCAFTGKAASVLRARTGLDVSTIHSALYHYGGQVEDEWGVKGPNFISKRANFYGRVLLVDEKSTVGKRLGDEMFATGAKIIACGDPGQLPPVRDVSFFDEKHVLLTTVHRQAWDNPIIRQAHAVRSGKDYRTDGDLFRVITRSEMTPEDVSFGDIALCYRNETRRRLNVSRRRALGITGKVLRAGEPVMVLKNDHALAVYNGAIYTVASDREPGDDLELIEDGGRRVYLFNTSCEMIDSEFETNKNDDAFSPVTLAYATTCHKFQGSETDNVLVVDEYNKEYQRAEWLYTALTRAAKRVLVIRA